MARTGQPSSKPLLDKLGVKPGARVAILGFDRGRIGLLGGSFVPDLLARTSDVSEGRPRKGTDLIFLLVRARSELGAVARLQRYLKPNGAIWVIRPKGTPEIKEVDVIAAGKRAGLVDNKIASFSESLSAMRLVIPLARR